MAASRPTTNPEWYALTVKAIAVCDRYGVLMDEVCSRSSLRIVVRAREAVALMLRREGLSYPRIGRILKKVHSTAIVAAQRAEAAGLLGPDGVHLGSGTNGPRDTAQGAVTDDATKIDEKSSVRGCPSELPA